MKKSIGNENRSVIVKEYIILFSFVVLIFLIYLSHINELGSFYVLDDEFGYWGNAAYLAGYDWSSAVSNISYYSYGYSIILVPLFWIFDNPIYMYRAAIIINAVMLSGSFLICYYIAKKLSKFENKYLLMAISFVIAIYPAYIVQANVAWSECALIFTCWLIVLCFVGMNEKTNSFKFLFLGVLSTYVYIIHQRSLGVFISSIIVVSFVKIVKRINWKQLSFYLLTVFIMLIIHKFVKNDIQTNNYLLSGTINNNDFAGQIVKVRNLFTSDGLKNFINIFISQFFYLGASSFLLCYVGLYEMVICFRQNIIGYDKGVVLNKIINNEKIHLFFFLFLSLFSTLIISAIFMINPNRIDHVIYGRYVEMILGPIILVGFLNFIEKDRIKVNHLALIIICFLLFTIITNLVLTLFNFSSYSLVCASSLIVRPEVSNNYNVYTSAFVASIGCLLIYFSNINRTKNKISIFLTLIGISIVFLWTSNSIVANNIVPVNKSRIQYSSITDYTNKVNSDYNIYFILSDEFNADSQKDVHQFFNKDKTIICINEDQLKSINEEKYVIVTRINKALDLLDEYDLCLNVNESYLLVSKNNNNYNNKIIKQGFNIPLDSFSKKNIENSDFIQSNGNEGIFMYGPYITLNSGNYKFEVELELIHFKQENMGYLDVVSNGNVLSKIELKSSDFKETNKIIIDIPLALEDTTKNLELRAYAYNGTQLRVNNISIFN